MTSPQQAYALFMTVDARKAFAPLTEGNPFFEISVATPKAGSLTERDKRDIVTYGPDQREAAVNAFFNLMRGTNLSGVIDTPEFRAYEETPSDFCDTVAVMIDGDETHPLNGIFENMIDMCPERSGEDLDFAI